MVESIYEVRDCPECSGNNLSYIEERDQVVCRDCGLVYEPLTPIEASRPSKTKSKKKPAAKQIKKKSHPNPAKKSGKPKPKKKKR